jgi:PPM family protein phosphatase
MKRKTHSHLPFAALSDAGLVRDHNEDNLAITAFNSVSELVPESLFCVLCDGVGGHLGGETASRMAIDQITSFIENSDASSPLVQLSCAIQSASEQVWQTAQSSAEFHGMASTAACAWIIGKRLFIATVGDSRIYLIKHNHIHQISIDHTWLQEALEAGLIKPADFKGHPNAHVIRRFIGSETPPDVDTRLKIGENPTQNQQGILLDAGDMLFLCSDGISDLIQENEIQTVLKQQHNLDAALETLKNLAYQRGASDNLSMILVKIPITNPPFTRKQKWMRLLIFAMVVLAAAFIGIYMGWLALYKP